MPETNPVIQAIINAVRAFKAAASNTPPKDIETAIEKIRTHSRDRARANAPIRTGALRKSIDVAATPGNGQIAFDFMSDSDYVLQTHEEQYRLGPISAAEPTTVEGGVGNKYFTRVVDRWGEVYMDQLMTAIIREMGGTEKR